MKKVFAIIAIMVVLVGSVFAVENAINQTSTITVKTLVQRSLPEFKLVGSLSATDAVPTGTITTVATHNNPQTAAYDGGAVNAEAIDISIDDITVYFAIYQTNMANVRASYNLAYTAGQLVRMSAQNSATAATGDEAYTINPTGTVGANGTAVVTSAIVAAEENETYLALDATTNLVAAYTGRVNQPAEGQSVSDLLLGTFNVKWLKDVEAKDGYYRADVVLAVTTV